MNNLKGKLTVILIAIATLFNVTGCGDESGSAKTRSVEGELTVHYIDVGQGDAVLMEYKDDGKDYKVMIDSGDWNNDSAVKYLEELGVKDIDLFVGSHPHSDHIGQMDKIINEFNVEEAWMTGDEATSQNYERVLDAIDENNVEYNEPRAGEEYDIGSLHIDIVSPKTINGELNNDSIVMKATYGETTFLFTGDVEAKAEQDMVNRGEDIKADILKVGHHGSDTSSTQEFIDKVDAEVGIISVGKDNKYKHPMASVVNRLEDKGMDVYATKDNGTIIVTTDGKDYDVTTNAEGKVTPESDGKDVQSNTQTTEQATESEQSETTGKCVDINTASKQDLQKITQVGESRADDIINGRPYDSVDDLTKISGLGESRINDIKEQGLACVQ